MTHKNLGAPVGAKETLGANVSGGGTAVGAGEMLGDTVAVVGTGVVGAGVGTGTGLS